MHLSIVTGTYNRYPRLQRFLASCREQIPAGVSYEFVITGVAGDEPTLTYLQQQPDVKLIVHEGLLGAVKAFTDACEMATGAYVLIANDDVEIIAGSILRAIVHLEENPRCGAVAFQDNRLNKDVFKVAMVPAIRNGVTTSVPYAQIGMVRRWLGEHVGWWSLHGTFPAKTYGADNAMSAAIHECGYTIDDVPGCQAVDHMEHDGLRDINTANPNGGEHPDSLAYYARWPAGPHIPNAVTVEAPKPNAREIGLRILYLPIYEAGRGAAQIRQRTQKHGLRDALGKLGMVYEFDYLTYQYKTAELWQTLAGILNSFQPDVLLTQCHATDVLTLEIMRNIRAHCPRLVMVNWNGDYWPDGQLDKKMLDWMRYVNLALVVNADILKPYEDVGIPAAYWQIGFEKPDGKLPAVKAHDVVFLGQNYNNYRREFGEALLSMTDEGVDVGIYGNYWINPTSPPQDSVKQTQCIYPDCTYDFLQGEALYKAAKLTVANNPFPESLGFVSNRIFQALAAGGALMLHQYVKGLERLTGLMPGVHFIEWKTYDELKQWLRYFLDPAHESERQKIVEAAYRFVQFGHSFDARVKQLFLDFIPNIAKAKLRRAAAVHYVGRRNTPFGVRGQYTQEIYQCVPGVPLIVDDRDLKAMLELEPELWQEVSGTMEGIAHGR
jgi:spore maturation protein CgeB/glycosyltransferase involved in cell wall biosynthesis